MFKYMYITNVPEIALYAESSGANRIFVDLECLGKNERQGHLNTFISTHKMGDIRPVRNVLSNAELLVRINPVHNNTEDEINSAIYSGADIIMLPMFKDIKEVEYVGGIINRRAKFIPLFETYEAVKNLNAISGLSVVDEFHIGLNDLHLDMKLSFMFELLSSGFIESMLSNVKKPFGIGGIARMGEGTVPAELVLAEHIRLGSSSVILSRAFHQNAKTLEELKRKINLGLEIANLESERRMILNLTQDNLSQLHKKFILSVEAHVRKINEKGI